MGILLNLLTFPVSGPIRGITWIARNIKEQAEREYYDEDAVRSQLLEIELRRDRGEIGEDDYLAAQDRLLERLQLIQERREADMEH
jgi:hypothetical protein